MIPYKDISAMTDDIMKGTKGAIIKAAVFLLIIVIAYFFGRDSVTVDNKQIMTGDINQTTQQYLSTTENNNSNNNCDKEGESFLEKESEWTTKHYKSPDNEGFYCPSTFSSFFSPDIWYKKTIPTIFKSLKIRYKVKNENNSTTTSPAFILSLGENPRVLRFYVGENNFQLVGFEKYDINSEKKLTREEPKELIAPIEYGTEVELTVRQIINSKNKLTFNFNLIYISALTGKSEEDDFSYEVIMPDPEPQSELSNIKIGFGTFKGNCAKPISYNFCY